MNKNQSRKGLALYEEVIEKNFELLQTFINKFPQIAKRHEHFDASILRLTERFNQHESELEKIKLQNKLFAEMIDRKLSALALNEEDRTVRRRISRNSPVEGQTPTHKSFSRNSSMFKDRKILEQDIEAKAREQQKQRIAQLNRQKLKYFQAEISEIHTKLADLSFANIRFAEISDNINSNKIDKFLLAQLADEVKNKVEKELSKKLQEQFSKFESQTKQTIQSLGLELASKMKNWQIQAQKQLKVISSNTVQREMFQQQLSNLKEVLRKVIDQANSIFADRVETKKALTLLEKKIFRLDLTISANCQLTYKQVDNSEGSFPPKNCIRAMKSTSTSQSCLLKKKSPQLMQGFGKRHCL